MDVGLTQRFVSVPTEEAQSHREDHPAVTPWCIMTSPHTDSLQALAGPPQAALLFSAKLSSFKLT